MWVKGNVRKAAVVCEVETVTGGLWEYDFGGRQTFKLPGRWSILGSTLESVLVRVTMALMKRHGEKQLEQERVHFTYISIS